MQVDQLHVPAIAARGAGSCRVPFGHSLPFGRSNNNRNSCAPSSPTLCRNVRTHQKRRGTSRTPLQDDSRRDSLAGASSSNGGKHISGVTTVQARGHNQRIRHSTGTSCSESSGAQTDRGKAHHLQQGHVKETLPPRFRNDHGTSQRKSSKKTSNIHAKSSKTSSTPKSTECPSSTHPPPPTLIMTAQTQEEQAEVTSAMESASKEQAANDVELSPSPKASSHQKMSSSADSGHYEEFTSSCESGVFEHSSLQATNLEHKEVELVSMVSSSGVESDQQRLSQDIASDLVEEDDEVFLDALSNIPSENSSAYMTPYSTRSRSPDPDCSEMAIVSLLAPDPSSSLDLQDSKSKLIKRLLELSDHDSSSSISTDGELSSPALERLESHDSHVTILADSVNREEVVLCSVSFTHASSVFDVEEDGERSSGSSEQTLLHEEVRTRQKMLSKDITNLYIGEMELKILSDGEDSAIDFEVKSSSPSLHEEDGDSGCATSIGSPDKTAPTLDFTRPGRLLPVGDRGSPRREREELSLSSMEGILGSADILIQHFSSSSDSGEHWKEREKEGETEEGKDEWPDLFADNVELNYPHTPAVGPPLPSLQPVNHPPMNGYIHPTPPPPFPPVSASGSGNSDSDPAVWMATINSHIRQQQQAVYQQHAANFNVMMYNGYPIGPHSLPPPPPPPTHPPHPAMFPGPAGFPGFYPPPPLPPNGAPPPFPPGPGYTPLPPPPLGPNGEFLPPLQHPLPLHHTLPLSQSPTTSTSEDTQASSVTQSSPSTSPSPSPVICEKHQLCSTWMLHYDKVTGSTRGQMVDYRDSLNHISTIDSIEDFWSTFNNIQPPSHLTNNTNYHFFKKGIQPLWEDEANKEGGKWVLTIKDDPRFLDQAWEEVLLMLIGGGMEQFDNVNGVVVSRRRKGDRIALWTRERAETSSIKVCVELVHALCIASDVADKDAQQFVKELADNQHGITLSYMYHVDSLKSGNSYTNEQHIKFKDVLDIIMQGLFPQ